MWVRTRVHLAKGEAIFDKFRNFLAIPGITTHIICDALLNVDTGVYILGYPSGGYNEATVIGNVNNPSGAVVTSTVSKDFRTLISSYADLSRLNDYTGELPRPLPAGVVVTQEEFEA